MFDTNKLKHAIEDLEEDMALDMLEKFMASNPSIEEAHEIANACLEGMSKVEFLFKMGESLVGDFIVAREIAKESIDILKPALSQDFTIKSVPEAFLIDK